MGKVTRHKRTPLRHENCGGELKRRGAGIYVCYNCDEKVDIGICESTENTQGRRIYAFEASEE